MRTNKNHIFKEEAAEVDDSVLSQDKKLKFMQGYKTYTGIIIMLLGVFGLGDKISADELGKVLDLAFQLLGAILSLYGNYKAHREITALGGYRK